MPLSNISCLVFSLHLSGGNSSAIGHVLIVCLIVATGTRWEQKRKDKERQVSVREINRGDSGLVLYRGAMGDKRQISRLVLLEVTI